MSRGSELGLWLLAGTVSIAVHAGGVSAALLMAEDMRGVEPPQARLEVISLPTTTAQPVTSLARAEQTNAKRLAPSTLQAVKPETQAAQAVQKVAPAPLAALDSAKPDVASAAAPEGLEPALADTLAALDPARSVASAAKPEELRPAVSDAAPAAAPPTASPSQPLPGRTAASAPDAVAAVSDEPVLAPDVKGKSVAAVAATESVAVARPDAQSVEKQVSVQLAPTASASLEATATARAEPVKPGAPLASAATRVAPTVNVPAAAAPAPAAAVAAPPAAAVAVAVPPSPPVASKPAQAATAPASGPVPEASAPVVAGPDLAADPAPPPAASAQAGGAIAKPGTDSGEQEVALLVPAIPAVPAPGPVDPYASALRFLQQRDSGWCLLVMPAEADGGLLGLDGFADHEAALDNFLRAFKSETRVDAATRSGTVSPTQCRVLNFARNLARYPAFSLRFRLDNRVVGSGQALAGTIENAGAAPLHLLLVDDEGKVQNLDTFLSRRGVEASFSAPMTLTSGPVATDQLLIALAGASELKTIADLDGDKADQFFDRLAEELADQNVSPDLAIVSFTVK